MLIIEVANPFPKVFPVPNAPADPWHEALTVGSATPFDGSFERSSPKSGRVAKSKIIESAEIID
jgi:hypothetical protein